MDDDECTGSQGRSLTRERRPRGALERTLATIPPASGAVVMATGVVSIGLSLDGRETLSRILLVAAAAAWVVLGLLLVARALVNRDRVHHEACSPAALTGVAGTAVLGTRLTLLGWGWVGIALLVISLGFWLALLGPVLVNWATPTIGVSFVLAVSTESLAVLAATLAEHERAPWLLGAALAPLALGLAFYVFVLARFDLRQITTGRGDHWVAGGALAISTLAAGRIVLGAASLHTLTTIDDALKVISLVLWGLAMAWLPVLAAAELLHPRTGYDVRRWATVFPVAMYAVCSFTVGSAANAPAITDFARVWVWAGAALWLAVAVPLLRSGMQLVRGRHPPITGERIEAIAPTRRSMTGPRQAPPP